MSYRTAVKMRLKLKQCILGFTVNLLTCQLADVPTCQRVNCIPDYRHKLFTSCASHTCCWHSYKRVTDRRKIWWQMSDFREMTSLLINQLTTRQMDMWHVDLLPVVTCELLVLAWTLSVFLTDFTKSSYCCSYIKYALEFGFTTKTKHTLDRISWKWNLG